MKRTYLFSAALLPALLLVGCNDPFSTKNFPDFSDVQFTVTSSNETSTGAYINISHDGTSHDTYCGFITTDCTTGIDAIVNQKIKELNDNKVDLYTEVKSGTARTAVLTGLQSGTNYRYVVFGLNTDGTTYGKSGECQFSTLKGAPELSINLVGNPTESTAMVSVTTTGDETDKWYCFVTTDVETSLATLCKNTLAGTANLNSKLQDGDKTLEFSSLASNTAYRAVVTGVKDGTVYGTPVAVEFRTTRRVFDVVKNPNWTIVDKGKGNLTDSEGNVETYDHIIECTAATNEDMYFIMVMDEAGMEYYNWDLVSFFSDACDYMTGLLKQFNAQYGANLTWYDISYTTSAKEGYTFDEDGNYYAYAIGVLPDGSPSGKYAVTDPIVVSVPMSDEFKAWIGKWTIGSGSTTYSINIKRNETEKSYAITGWQSEAVGDTPCYALFNAEDGSMSFAGSKIADSVTLTDGSGNQINCALWFSGIDTDSYVYTMNSVYEIAKSTFSNSDKTKASVTGNTVSRNDGSTATFATMGFIATANSGNGVYGFTETPTFPLTMTKSASSASASSFSVANPNFGKSVLLWGNTGMTEISSKIIR